MPNADLNIAQQSVASNLNRISLEFLRYRIAHEYLAHPSGPVVGT